MSDTPPCPECGSDFVYEDAALLVCPECAHEFSAREVAAKVYRDANGNELQDGDWVTLIKDLKVRGTSKTVKVGTKVRIIRLVDEDHDIDCKVDGIGAMKLKTEFVKRA